MSPSVIRDSMGHPQRECPKCERRMVCSAKEFEMVFDVAAIDRDAWGSDTPASDALRCDYVCSACKTGLDA